MTDAKNVKRRKVYALRLLDIEFIFFLLIHFQSLAEN